MADMQTVGTHPEARLAPALSFESLLGQVLPRAYGVACNLTGNRVDAEDLLQEAALNAFRAFATFTPGTSFKAWFYKILTNCHFERYRRTSRRLATVDLDDVPDLYMYQRTAEAGLHSGCDDPARLVMSKMTTDQVMATIADLPDEYQVVATLYFVDEMKYEEMAEMLGCPVGTVRSRLHRSRKMLQKNLWTVAKESGIVGELTSRRPPA
jgi:RNA polymerase sigma-70 factor, ECF subfamily